LIVTRCRPSSACGHCAGAALAQHYSGARMPLGQRGRLAWWVSRSGVGDRGRPDATLAVIVTRQRTARAASHPG
jgi:hypothetical protein